MPQIIKIKGQRRTKSTPPRTFMGFQLDKNDLFNGKPLTHWLDMADELVMSTIIRGINPDKLSLVQTAAAERLRGLAIAINPQLYYRLTEERDRCRSNVGLMVGAMMGWELLPTPATHGYGAMYCAKHAPKAPKKAKPRKRR